MRYPSNPHQLPIRVALSQPLAGQLLREFHHEMETAAQMFGNYDSANDIWGNLLRCSYDFTACRWTKPRRLVLLPQWRRPLMHKGDGDGGDTRSLERVRVLPDGRT